MAFTEKIEKLLASNHVKEVIDEFLKFLNEVPQSKSDAKSDAGELRGQIIVLSGRFTDLNSKINTNTVSPDAANQEKATIIQSFIKILNQLPSSYPDLNTFMEEKNEDDDWNDAQHKNTIDAYQIYFNKYPNGKYKADTLKLIADLEDVKQKQDNEIKRLALLEKERRENDKLAGETQRIPSTQPSYQSNDTGPSAPAKSKTGLFIGIGVAVIAIILIVVMMGKKSPAAAEENNETTAAPAEAVEPSDAVKAELTLAIESANQTFIKAMQEVNKEILSASFKGEALKSLTQRIDNEIAKNYYTTSRTTAADYKSFKITGDGIGETAEVVVLETWVSTYYKSGTNDCLQKELPFQQTKTAFLNKTENGWIITAYIFSKETPPPPIPCDQAN